MEHFKATTGLYSPLDRSKKEIRLVKLDTNSIDEISCTLSDAYLDGSKPSPPFVALSYVWGSPTDTERILLNGQDFQATANLAAFLRVFRKFQEAFNNLQLPIWVDALAINQIDPEERASQVALMRDIYTTANFSVSWLGPEATYSSLAIETITMCATAFKQMDGNSDPLSWLEGHADLITKQERSDDIDILDLTESDVNRKWGAVHEFFSIPYWKRTWIYQELVLPQNVYLLYGFANIELQDLIYFACWTMAVKNQKKPQFMDTMTWAVLQRLASREEILVIMRLFMRRTSGVQSTVASTLDDGNVMAVPTGLKASNPRDVIYGILGVVPFPIIIDYQKSIENVYLEYATFVAEKGHLTEVLSAANKVKNIQNLPTWVPDLSEGLFSMAAWNSKDKNSSRSQGNTLPYPVKIRDRVLHASGVICEALLDIGETFIDAGFISSRLLDEEFMRDRIQRWRTPYPTGIPFHLALLRVLLEDRDPTSDTSIDEVDPERFFVLAVLIYLTFCSAESGSSNENRWSRIGFKDDIFSADEFQAMLSNGAKFEKPDDYAKRLRETVNDDIANIAMKIDNNPKLRLFITRNGYLGSAKETMKRDDLVCVLFGSRLPVILRPVDDHFELIDKCFILGFMDGGAVTDAEEGRREVRQFEIW